MDWAALERRRRAEGEPPPLRGPGPSKAVKAPRTAIGWGLAAASPLAMVAAVREIGPYLEFYSGMILAAMGLVAAREALRKREPARFAWAAIGVNGLLLAVGIRLAFWLVSGFPGSA